MNTTSNQKRVHHVGSDKWQQMHSLLSPGNKNTSAMKIAKVTIIDKVYQPREDDCFEIYLQAKDKIRLQFMKNAIQSLVRRSPNYTKSLER